MTGLCTELRETAKRLPEYIRKQCTKYIFQKQATDRGTFIFALNPGLHWIAFKIDFSKKYIASMCSLQDPQIDMAQAIKSWISSLCADARNFEHYSVAVPNQRNAVDCGPLCCMFLLFLSQNDISRSTKLEYDTISTASAMRLRIFADIAQKKITPLVTKNGQLYAEKK
jgi:Ulp1 family protease